VKDPKDSVNLEKLRKKILKKYKWGFITLDEFMEQLSKTYREEKTSHTTQTGGDTETPFG
tara:strand:+ start:4155 stop:4334 length:180 start_codon:yes stop_codon:yes gene_type:complete